MVIWLTNFKNLSIIEACYLGILGMLEEKVLILIISGGSTYI